MTAPALTLSVYCTIPLSGVVSDHGEHWARLGDVATLPCRKLGTSYGRCLALSGGGYRSALFHLGAWQWIGIIWANRHQHLHLVTFR